MLTQLSSIHFKKLLHVGYDSHGSTVELQLTGGTIYHYRQVRDDLVIKLITAKSKGEFFKHVVGEQFTFTRVQSKLKS